MRGPRWGTRLYGAGLGHALLLLGSFAFTGYVVSRIVEGPHPGWIAIWMGGAVVAHDLVLYPLYTLADRLVLPHRRHPTRPAPAVPWRNHVRAPALVSGLLLLITFPLVTRLSGRNYVAATGLDPSVYLGRWLLVSGAAFTLSGAVYMVRRVAHRDRVVS